MNKKYKMKKDRDTGLYRITALRDFGNVRKGDVGGLIEKESNLSVEGNAWVSRNAKVFGDAEVYGNAKVYGNAVVFGNAEVYGSAEVYGNARVYENAEVYGDARVFGDAEVYRNAWVSVKCLTVTGIKHDITCTDKHIAIGCEMHTFTHWKKHIKEIGKKNGYTPTEIKEYTELVNILIKQMKRQLREAKL